MQTETTNFMTNFKVIKFPLKFNFLERSEGLLTYFTHFTSSVSLSFPTSFEQKTKKGIGRGEELRCVFLFRRKEERQKAIGSLRGNIAISISVLTPRNTRNDLRSGAWCFDGGQPEVNLRFTRQYRLLLAPPRALPRVPRGTARARAPHNSHNKSPRTTDARSTYKGITDQKEDRRVGKRRGGRGREGGGKGRGKVRNNGSTQIAKPLLRKALLLHPRTRGGPADGTPANL